MKFLNQKTSLLLTLVLLLFIYLPVYADHDHQVVIPRTGAGAAALKSIGKAFTKKGDIEVIIPKDIGSEVAIRYVVEEKIKLGRVDHRLQESENHYELEYSPVFEMPKAITLTKKI